MVVGPQGPSRVGQRQINLQRLVEKSAGLLDLRTHRTPSSRGSLRKTRDGGAPVVDHGSEKGTSVDDFAEILTWLDRGERVVAATLVRTDGSTSHDVGATFFVSDRHVVAGAVSGGCVEAALFTEADAVFASNAPRLVTYGPEDESPFGLTCGGTIEVFVRLLDRPSHAAIVAALERRDPAVLATRRVAPFDVIAVTRDRVVGSCAPSGVETAVGDEACAMLDGGDSMLRSYGPDGEPIGEAERWFFQLFAQPPVLYVVGAIDFTRPLTVVAKLLGFRVVVIDPRPIFATPARIPEADEIVLEWPDDVIAARVPDARSAVVVLTHDAKFDIPVILASMKTPVGYLGVMGSRATHRKRLETLRDAGLRDDELARVHAPIGLDIGARSPEETAVAIVAEIIAARNARNGGRLRDADGNLRGRPLVDA